MILEGEGEWYRLEIFLESFFAVAVRQCGSDAQTSPKVF
jgi:hypothetical protein